MKLKLSTPKMITFWIAVVLAVLGIIAELLKHSTYAFLGALLAFIVLAAGNLFDGL
jgi:hypothetical protein